MEIFVTNLYELLAQCNAAAEVSEEDSTWLDDKPTVKVILLAPLALPYL